MEIFFRGGGGSKRPPRMFKFFSGGKVGGRGGKSGFQRGGKLTEF